MFPIRTCIKCKAKNIQKEMSRLQIYGDKIIFFKNSGRSFYICNICLYDQKLKKFLKKFFKKDVSIEGVIIVKNKDK